MWVTARVSEGVTKPVKSFLTYVGGRTEVSRGTLIDDLHKERGCVWSFSLIEHQFDSSGTLFALVARTWQPIDLSDLQKIIQRDLAACSDEQCSFLTGVAIQPEKWVVVFRSVWSKLKKRYGRPGGC